MQRSVNYSSDLDRDYVFNLSYSVSNPDYLNALLQNNEIFSEFYSLVEMAIDDSLLGALEKASTTEISPNLYDIHRIVPNTRTAPIPEKTDTSHLAEKKRLVAIMQSCYFEAGIWTEADEYFECIKKKSNSLERPLKLLSDIVNHSLSNEHVLEGALHILSNYSYDEVDPYGITIAIACAVNHSPVIQDLLISCFEKWGSIDSIDILEGLELKAPWLAEYRDEVVLQLKNQEVIA